MPMIPTAGAACRSHANILARQDFKVVNEELIRAGANDLNPILTRVRVSRPDVLVVLAQAADFINVAKQIHVARLPVAYMAAGGDVSSPEWQNAVGEAQEGWIGIAPYVLGLGRPGDPDHPEIFPSQNDWETQFRAKHHRDPNWNDAQTYTASAMLLLAVDQGGDDQDKVHAALRAMDVKTVMGRGHFTTSSTGGTINQAFEDVIIFQRQSSKNLRLLSVRRRERKTDEADRRLGKPIRRSEQSRRCFMAGVEVVGPSNRLGSHSPIPHSVVKSAGRVMQIMEFFDDVRRPASAVEVGSSLGYPQSSTSMLLHSMSVMGYLHHDPERRTYMPSSRLALAGAWLNDRLLEKGPLLELMENLHEITEQAVLLSMRQGIFGQYIHVVQAVQKVGHLVVGTKRHLTSTGTGYALLSTLPDRQVQRIVHSIGADIGRTGTPVKLPAVLDTVNRLRRGGYLQASSLTITGGSSIAIPLHGASAEAALAIAVFGASDTIDANLSDFLQLMRELICRYCRRFEVAETN